MWQSQWAATIWKIAGSGFSIKLLSVMQLLSAIKPDSVLEGLLWPFYFF